VRSADGWTLPVSAEPPVRVSVHKSQASHAPAVFELTFENGRLPALHPRRVYVVSDMARRQYPWRPDFVSPTREKGGELNAAGAFHANPGYAAWARRDWDRIQVVLWPDAASRAIAAMPDPLALILQVLDMDGLPLEGAINIPPMNSRREQLRMLNESLPEGFPVRGNPLKEAGDDAPPSAV
jgi:hypothetical protein